MVKGEVVYVKWLEYVFFVVFVTFFLGFLSSLFSVDEKTGGNMEIYECGIESMVEEKVPFYLHFFMTGILFLLFDVELVICIPLVMMYVYEGVWGLVWFVFFFILLVGLIMEVMMETVSWKE